MNYLCTVAVTFAEMPVIMDVNSWQLHRRPTLVGISHWGYERSLNHLNSYREMRIKLRGLLKQVATRQRDSSLRVGFTSYYLLPGPVTRVLL
jgi:hypothetical protein